jgi:hypothetical protein
VRKDIVSNGHQRKSNKNSILGISFLVNLSNVKKFGHINGGKQCSAYPTHFMAIFTTMTDQHTTFHENLHTPHEDCFA